MQTNWGNNKATKITKLKKKPKYKLMSGRTKVIDGKTYELHPTKGWRKKEK